MFLLAAVMNEMSLCYVLTSKIFTLPPLSLLPFLRSAFRCSDNKQRVVFDDDGKARIGPLPSPSTSDPDRVPPQTGLVYQFSLINFTPFRSGAFAAFLTCAVQIETVTASPFNFVMRNVRHQRAQLKL